MKKFTSISVVTLLSTLTSGLAIAAEPGFSNRSAVVTLPNISVTEQAKAGAFYDPIYAQSVTVISREQLEQSSVTNVNEALGLINGVTVQRRGMPGMQADISVRGSNFKQVLLLINGVPYNSAQTGHLNSVLPVPFSAIERIEVVKGPGAVEYAGLGNGGIINFITRQPEQSELEVDAALGSHDSRQATGIIGTKVGDTSHLFSASGYRNGDYDLRGDLSRTPQAFNPPSKHPNAAENRQLFYAGATQKEAWGADWGATASRHEFDAFGFYSDKFPVANELTHSGLAWVNTHYTTDRWRLHARGYARQQEDHFDTQIGANSYINEHRTTTTGADIDALYDDALGTTGVGGKVQFAKMTSNTLQGPNAHRLHHRNQSTLWLNRQQQLGDKLTATVGLNWVDYQRYGDYLLPSAALAWQFSPLWLAHINWGKSARQPTYTELYANSSSDKGNAKLKVEKSTAQEVGIDGKFKQQRLSLAAFQRKTTDFIDFVENPPGGGVFYADNLNAFETQGGNASWTWVANQPLLEQFTLDYERLHFKADAETSKNTLRLPWQTWRMQTVTPLPWHLRLTVDVRRPTYRGQDDATQLGSQLSWKKDEITVYIKGQNLLNKDTIEAGFAPVSGRWVMAGVNYRIAGF